MSTNASDDAEIEKLEAELRSYASQSARTQAERNEIYNRCAEMRRHIELVRAGLLSTRPGMSRRV